MVWPVIAKMIASKAGSTLLSQGAGSVLGNVGASGGGLLGAISNPRTSIGEAFKTSSLRKLMQDPDEFMQTQIQDFIDNEGRMPDQSELLSMRKAANDQMNEMYKIAMSQAASMQVPSGGFINQNPNFLNTAQRRLG
tara:strand:- start:5752 stop:6162 length:411 start_codon:yes stop_codon:yes gene_type:complete